MKVFKPWTPAVKSRGYCSYRTTPDCHLWVGITGVLGVSWSYYFDFEYTFTGLRTLHDIQQHIDDLLIKKGYYLL